VKRRHVDGIAAALACTLFGAPLLLHGLARLLA
jgi:hypothetical protein